MQIARPGMTEAQIAARVYEKAHAANCEISFPIIATINGHWFFQNSYCNKLVFHQLV
jgi:Xaa-Pro aminopeptidase